MNKKIMLILFAFFIVLTLSGCSAKGKIEAQKQKELDVIKAQQDKEIAVEKQKETQRQEQEDKLNACFEEAKLKRATGITESFKFFTKDKCPGMDYNNLVEAGNCIDKLSPATIEVMAKIANDYKNEEKNDLEMCLKIYPQA